MPYNRLWLQRLEEAGVPSNHCLQYQFQSLVWRAFIPLSILLSLLWKQVIMKAYYTRLKLLYMKTAVEHHLRWSFLSSGDSAGTWRQLAPPSLLFLQRNSLIPWSRIRIVHWWYSQWERYFLPAEWYDSFLRWWFLCDVECHFLSAHLILFFAVSLHLTSVLCMKLCHNWVREKNMLCLYSGGRNLLEVATLMRWFLMRIIFQVPHSDLLLLLYRCWCQRLILVMWSLMYHSTLMAHHCFLLDHII